jgi:hypothetical protein
VCGVWILGLILIRLYGLFRIRNTFLKMLARPGISDTIPLYVVNYMSRSPASNHESVSAQFNRLVRDLINGTLKRSKFHRWEIELLLDISQCALPEKRRWKVLRDYQVTVRRLLLEGTSTPVKLSEYLAAKRTEA